MIHAMALRDARLSGRGIFLCLTGLLATIIAIGVLGQGHTDLAIGITGLLLVATALIFPRVGLALLVMVTPIQALGGLSRSEMPLLLGALMAAINLRHITVWLDLVRLKAWKELPPLILVLSFFVLLFVVRSLIGLPDMLPAHLNTALLGCAFAILLFGVTLAVSRHCAAENGNALRRGLIGSVFLAIALTLFFNVIAVYFPQLSTHVGLMSEPSGLRLAGLHANPNATAKYLLAGLAFAVAASWHFSGFDIWTRSVAVRWRPLTAALLIGVVCVMAISATLSKSSMIGALGAPLVAAVAFWTVSRRAAVMATLSTILILTAMLGFNVVLADGLAKWTIRQHRAATQTELPPAQKPSTDKPAKEPAKEKELTERIGAQLRLRFSQTMTVEEDSKQKPQEHSEIYRNINGKIDYTTRKCESLLCTGQRDTLWKTGLVIWTDHWLIGIGPTAWTSEYERRLKFPFDSPHNIVLEMAGGFGLAGLILYGLFLWSMWRVVRVTFTRPADDTTAILYSRGVLLFALAIMATEVFDPAKFFSMNPHAIWVWMLLAGTYWPRTALADKTPSPTFTDDPMP